MKRAGMALVIALVVMMANGLLPVPQALGAGLGSAEGGVNSIGSMQAPGFGGPLSQVVVPERYHVGPGDQFTLWLWGPFMRSQVLTVGVEGDVVIPEIGVIRVAGMTLKDARDLFRSRIQRALRNVQIDVQLSRVRSFRVYLAGAVLHPGPIIVMGTDRVLDLLADSLLLASASRRNIELRHGDGGRTIVDLERFRVTGEDGSEPLLVEGDVIHVPYAKQFIGAWGAVGHAGTLELGPQDSVSTLLRLSGGVMPSQLAEDARLVRWVDSVHRETHSVRIAGGLVTSGDALLRDGDQLFVLGQPGWHESMQVWVVGRVQREGAFPIQLGSTRLTDLITAAGGFLEDADQSSIHLIRGVAQTQADPEFDRLLRLSRGEMTMSEYESFRARLASRSPDVRVDWHELTTGRKDLDLLLQDGDVIRVERRITAVRVDGQVRRPGLLPFTPGRSVAWYIEQAGGFTRRGARTQVRLTRSTNGQSLLARDANEVSPGDQLWVPERPDISAWQYLRDGLTAAAQFATVWLAVRR